MMSFFKRHVFFCLNERPAGNACCHHLGAVEMQNYAKKRIKALGLAGPGAIRINRAGCLGRCDEGPVLVVYPDNVWYQYVDQEDIDEIIEEHLIHGRIVNRLKI
jgi:(2Fe-2S) ferredoxin